jgi:hypothetical protein
VLALPRAPRRGPPAGRGRTWPPCAWPARTAPPVAGRSRRCPVPGGRRRAGRRSSGGCGSSASIAPVVSATSPGRSARSASRRTSSMRPRAAVRWLRRSCAGPEVRPSRGHLPPRGPPRPRARGEPHPGTAAPRARHRHDPAGLRALGRTYSCRRPLRTCPSGTRQDSQQQHRAAAWPTLGRKGGLARPASENPPPTDRQAGAASASRPEGLGGSIASGVSAPDAQLPMARPQGHSASSGTARPTSGQGGGPPERASSCGRACPAQRQVHPVPSAQPWQQ